MYSSEETQKAIDLIKERLSAIPKFEGRVVLLFSGGRDSSLVAASFCKAFPGGQLHLLLIDNGLLSRLDAAKRQATLLQNLFPMTDIKFEMKRVSQMMRQVGMQQVEKDFTEHGFHTLLICLSCKLIMICSAMRYAKELEIPLIIDGYANRQRGFPEQTEEFMSVARNLYKEAGLIYLSPLYDFLVNKDLVNKVLGELGIYIPKQEPICMWADAFSVAEPEEISRYIQKTLTLIRQTDVILHC